MFHKAKFLLIVFHLPTRATLVYIEFGFVIGLFTEGSAFKLQRRSTNEL